MTSIEKAITDAVQTRVDTAMKQVHQSMKECAIKYAKEAVGQVERTAFHRMSPRDQGHILAQARESMMPELRKELKQDIRGYIDYAMCETVEDTPNEAYRLDCGTLDEICASCEDTDCKIVRKRGNDLKCAGNFWNDHEDMILRKELNEFIKFTAITHHRTKGAIVARMAKLRESSNF